MRSASRQRRRALSNNPRAARTRAALVAAGRRLSSERPIEAVAIDDIVSAAEVGKGSFYNHFTDREALARAISAEIRALIEQRVDEANASETDPAMRIARAMCTFVRFALDDPERGRIIARAQPGFASPSARLNRGVVADIEKGMRTNRLSVETLEAGTLFVVAVTHALLGRVLEKRKRGLAGHLAQDACALTLQGHGIREREAREIAASAVDTIVRRRAFRPDAGDRLFSP